MRKIKHTLNKKSVAIEEFLRLRKTSPKYTAREIIKAINKRKVP